MHISYTKQAANAVRYAAKKAKEMKHPYIGTEHLLLGLREEFSGVAGQVLAQNGVETEKIMQLMDELIAPMGGDARIAETERKSKASLYPREQ